MGSPAQPPISGEKHAVLGLGEQGHWTCPCRAGEHTGWEGGMWKVPVVDISVPCPCAGNWAFGVQFPSTRSVLATELKWKDEGGRCQVFARDAFAGISAVGSSCVNIWAPSLLPRRRLR